MKAYLGPFARLLVKLILVQSAAALFIVLQLWTEGFLKQGFPLGLFLANFIFLSFPVQILVMISSLFKLLSADKGRFFSRLLFMFVAAGFFWLALWAWPQVELAYPAKAESFPLKSDLISGDTARQILPLTNKSDKNTESTEVIIISDPGIYENLRYFNGQIKEVSTSWKLMETSGAMLDLSPYVPYETYEMDGIGRTVLASVSKVLSSFLNFASRSTALQIIYAASLAYFLMSLWALVRLTRWPLFNASLVIVSVVAVFNIYSIFRADELQDLLRALHSLLPDYYFALSFVLIGSILALLPLVMPPFKDWKRQVQP